MNSCLYSCDVMHYRMDPVQHKFAYHVFMFYLDLDELDLIHQSTRLVSHNRPNLFGFHDRDYLPGLGNAKENLRTYLRTQGLEWTGQKAMLLTYLRTFGYIFNPVSFYFCFDSKGNPQACVPVVTNTYREMKPYFLGPSTWDGHQFQRTVTKFFYVSPFVDLDADFEFRLTPPTENLNLHVDDWRKGKKFFLSSLTGIRRPLTDASLLKELAHCPWVTIKVISAIHWQAMRLHFQRKVPYHKKASHPELQREIVYAKHPD